MSPEREGLLVRKYPKIFNLPGSSNEPIGVWGLECGDGWFELIDTLCGLIQQYVDWRSKSIDDPTARESLQPVAQQVKEKFGGLRFYADGGDETTNAFIQFAEAMSLKVCESCGNPGRQQKTGWIHTYCDPCFQGRMLKK